MKLFRFFLTISILLAAAGLSQFFSRPDLSMPRKSLKEFPRSLGEWIAISDNEIDNRSMAILQVDDYIMRTYRNTKGEIVSLYIGYFACQREGKGIHSPRQCLPGSGWIPVDTAIHQMKVYGHNPETVPVNRYLMGKGLDRELYLFWYQGRGRIYASEYWNKIYLIWDGLTKKRTDGALVRINLTVRPDVDRSVEPLFQFTNLLVQELTKYIPN